MNTSPLNAASLSLSLNQFKTQALQSLIAFDSSTDAAGLFATAPHTGGMFEQWLAAAKQAPIDAPASRTPSGLDALGGFSVPGQNVVTVINRVDVSFKAQFSALSELKGTLAQAQASANDLAAIDAQTASAEVKSKLLDFIATYNTGVNRFAPEVAPGGILEGSQEASRARFATRRDIADPLIGATDGLRGGMLALGISVDPRTGLASLDEAQLDAILAQDTDADARTIIDFAQTFIRTTTILNSEGNQQDRQLSNLDRAIHWIADNRVSVENEFGPGQAATPNPAFAKAAAAYALIGKQ